MQPGRFEVGGAYVGARGRLRILAVFEAGTALDSATLAVSVSSAASDAGSATETLNSVESVSAAVLDAGSASDTSYGGSLSLGSVFEAGSATETSIAFAAFPGARTEAGSALDASSAIVALVANDNESGAAVDSVGGGQVVPLAVVEYPSRLGAGAVGSGYVGSGPVGGPPVGASDAIAFAPSIAYQVAEIATAVDAVSSGGQTIVTVSESTLVPVGASAIGSGYVGASSVGGPPSGGAQDAPAAGLVQNASVVEAPIGPSAAVGSSYVGASAIGAIASSIVRPGARDSSSTVSIAVGFTSEFASAEDLLYSFRSFVVSLTETGNATDLSSRGGTINVSFAEVAFLVDVLAEIASLFQGVVITTTGSGLAFVGVGTGVEIVTEGSGMSAVGVGSGVNLVTIGSGLSFTGVGSGLAFTGAHAMATKINASFYYAEDWLILGTATDFQGRILDLTNASVNAKIFVNSVNLLDVAVGDGITITDAPGGKYRIDINPTEQIASEVVPGDYGIQVKVVTADGITSIQLDGTITVKSSAFTPA
jgi:hypothetical protein